MLMELIRARERGIIIGSLPPGPLNRISDVPGVKVGHCTLAEGDIQTGVTVILPPPENPFIEKLPAAAYVQNGFGKTLGLIQIDELGTLETPIALCGTLNVGRVHDALVSYMVRLCARDGIHLTSVNPVVGECNDGFLSDIQARPCGEAELLAAIAGAEADFPLGSVGAGRGTSCHSLKGGIGSASRQLELDGEVYTVGVLVQTNHGRLADLRLPDGRKPEADFIRLHDGEAPDKGSCMMVLATDAPLSDRQLRRVIRRMPVGLIRLGSYIGHGSGEICIGFSTANPVSIRDSRDILPVQQLNEKKIDLFFRAAAEAAEEAVLDSMLCAGPVTGWQGHHKDSLSEIFG